MAAGAKGNCASRETGRSNPQPHRANRLGAGDRLAISYIPINGLLFDADLPCSETLFQREVRQVVGTSMGKGDKVSDSAPPEGNAASAQAKDPAHRGVGPRAMMAVAGVVEGEPEAPPGEPEINPLEPESDPFEPEPEGDPFGHALEPGDPIEPGEGNNPEGTPIETGTKGPEVEPEPEPEPTGDPWGEAADPLIADDPPMGAPDGDGRPDGEGEEAGNGALSAPPEFEPLAARSVTIAEFVRETFKQREVALPAKREKVLQEAKFEPAARTPFEKWDLLVRAVEISAISRPEVAGPAETLTAELRKLEVADLCREWQEATRGDLGEIDPARAETAIDRLLEALRHARSTIFWSMPAFEELDIEFSLEKMDPAELAIEALDDLITTLAGDINTLATEGTLSRPSRFEEVANDLERRGDKAQIAAAHAVANKQNEIDLAQAAIDDAKAGLAIIEHEIDEAVDPETDPDRLEEIRTEWGLKKDADLVEGLYERQDLYEGRVEKEIDNLDRANRDMAKARARQLQVEQRAQDRIRTFGDNFGELGKFWSRGKKRGLEAFRKQLDKDGRVAFDRISKRFEMDFGTKLGALERSLRNLPRDVEKCAGRIGDVREVMAEYAMLLEQIGKLSEADLPALEPTTEALLTLREGLAIEIRRLVAIGAL